MKILLFLVLLLNINCIVSQNTEETDSYYSKGKVKLEIVPFKMSINPGIYRSRIHVTPGVENKFNQLGGFVQFYFPFQRSIDKLENFKKVAKDSSYYGRLIAIRPLALIHVTNKGGNGTGLGIEFSLRLKKRLFFKPQLNLVWVEADNSVDDGLKRGLNFHHFWYLSYFISHKTAISLGFNHISNGDFLSSRPTSNYDMITVGVSYSFK